MYFQTESLTFKIRTSWCWDLGGDLLLDVHPGHLPLLAGGGDLLLDVHPGHLLHHRWQASHNWEHLGNCNLKPSFFRVNTTNGKGSFNLFQSVILKSFKPVSAPTSSVILLAPTGPSPVLTIVILSVSARGALTSAATRGRTWFERKKVCWLGLNVFLFLSLIKYQGKSGLVFFKDVSQLP